MSSYRSKFRILSTGFRYPDSRLFYGRASLYFDRIELGGLGLGGRHSIVIALADVNHFEMGTASANLVSIGLKSGKVIELVLNDSPIWERYLRSRLAWRNRLEQPPIPSQEHTFMLNDTAGAPISIS